MSDFGDRLKKELSSLGFDWDNDKMIKMPNHTNKNKSFATCTISMEHVNDTGKPIKDILIFDFNISLKEAQEMSLIDHMLVRLERCKHWGEKPTILMQQTFQSHWGILPSKQHMLQRACDYLSPVKIDIRPDASLDQRLKTELERLGFEYEKMMRFPASGNGICIGNITSLEYISTKKDQLVTTFQISPAKDQTTSPIESMTASLRRETQEGDICLMREHHYTEFETLPLKQHLYNRSCEMVIAMKVKEKFSINENDSLQNDQIQSHQIKRNR